MSAAEVANNWLKATNIDTESKKEIERLLLPENSKELEDSFYKELEFGTGGLRGIMGMGSNRMNKYSIGKATQGLANYLLKNFPGESISVAIAHDSRNNSPEFSQICADVFSANGIEVYLFKGLRPTPELSFAIRQLGCKSGVVLTASHNPKEYNGYKAYWMDGAQVTPPHDENIITEVLAVKTLDDIRFDRKHNLVHTIGNEVDEKYLQMLVNLSLSPEAIKSQASIPIVYSPIHGTGAVLVPEALKRMGFKNIHVVEEQMIADGNFPTVVYPNPEESEALSMAIAKAEATQAELVMATDPDADRVGIAVPDKSGKFQLLNGNQTGSLLIQYLLEKWESNNKLTGKEYVVKTIVTTELIKSIANKYRVNCYDTLTGFKYIATMIRELEGKETFIGGGEESYGYLIGDDVRDKDAVASCAMIAEMCAFYKTQNLSLLDKLSEIYEEHGFYYESLVSITKKGKEGAEEIQEMMKKFRTNPPRILSGSNVALVLDYQEQIRLNMMSGESSKLEFPSSNVLQFITEDGMKISARPSGTEPKIKFYFGVKVAGYQRNLHGAMVEAAKNKIETAVNDLGV